MNAILKGLLIASPLLALTFWYVVSQQNKIDTSIHKDDLQFEREWNEFNGGGVSNQTRAARASKADAQLADIEKQEELDRVKARNFEKDFDKAIDEAGKELEAKAGKPKVAASNKLEKEFEGGR